MKQANPAYYFQMINDIISDTETEGAKMHPYYEKLRKAIDENTALSQEELAKIELIFEEGCAAYDQYQAKLENLKAPVKLLGVHTNFVKYYRAYVQACHEMLKAVNPEEGLNVARFNQSEKDQDEYSQKTSQTVARMATMALR